jgi:hypothetical protein
MSDNHIDWPDELPLVQWVMNNQISRMSGFSPFQLTHGRDATLPYDLVTHPSKPENYHTVDDYADQLHNRLNKAFTIARDNISASGSVSKRHYDSKSKDTTYQLGALVYLHNPVNKKSLNVKWQRRWYGPFRILESPYTKSQNTGKSTYSV